MASPAFERFRRPLPGGRSRRNEQRRRCRSRSKDGSREFRRTGPATRLKSDPQTSSDAPNHPATLLGTTEDQLKPIRQPGLPEDFEAGATRGIVDNGAVNKRVFRPNDQFGRTGTLACRSNASEPSRIHTPPLALTQKIRPPESQNILNTSFSFIVIETHTLVVVKILLKSQTMPQASVRAYLVIASDRRRNNAACPGALSLNRRVAFAKDRTSAKRP